MQIGRSWPGESPYQEELELLRENEGMRLDGTMIRQAMKAGRAGDWSELFKSDKLNTWTRVKQQECYYEVRLEVDERKRSVRQILHKSNGLL